MEAIWGSSQKAVRWGLESDQEEEKLTSRNRGENSGEIWLWWALLQPFWGMDTSAYNTTSGGQGNSVSLLQPSGTRIGEANGNPLQCSCLENPVDRGIWWAAVHRVTQSQTGLKRLSMHWRRKWPPTPVFLPWESRGQRSLVGYHPWERKESDMTEWLTHTHLRVIVLEKVWFKSIPQIKVKSAD